MPSDLYMARSSHGELHSQRSSPLPERHSGKLLQVVAAIMCTLSLIYLGFCFLRMWTITSTVMIFLICTLSAIAAIIILDKSVRPAVTPFLLSVIVSSLFFALFWLVLASSGFGINGADAANYIRAGECCAVAVTSGIALRAFRKKGRGGWLRSPRRIV
jgi:hypothetical protein